MRALEILCWASGIALLAFYAGARAQGAARAQDHMDRFRETRAARVDTSLWSASRIEAYRKSVESSQEEVLGILRIDRVGLAVPVLRGTAGPTLDVGVGWIEGTASLGSRGNVGIAGHRDGFFRNLKDVVVGDVIEVEGPEGENRFVVRDTQVVEPDAIQVLSPTEEPTLTLVTCYPFYFVGSAPKRYIVRATVPSER